MFTSSQCVPAEATLVLDRTIPRIIVDLSSMHRNKMFLCWINGSKDDKNVGKSCWFFMWKCWGNGAPTEIPHSIFVPKPAVNVLTSFPSIIHTLSLDIVVNSLYFCPLCHLVAKLLPRWAWIDQFSPWPNVPTLPHREECLPPPKLRRHHHHRW